MAIARRSGSAPRPPVTWDSDLPADLPTLEANGVALVQQIVATSHRRIDPKRDLASKWHVALLRGTHVPEAAYRGGYRGDRRRPQLQSYEVAVVTTAGALRGVPARLVSTEITQFVQRLKAQLKPLDRRIPLGAERSPEDELEILTLAAWTHGEWIRIHPFANGNGRTARLWVIWVCARYGVEPFIVVRPRPTHLDFGSAAAASMVGDHSAMLSVLVDLLLDSRAGV